MNDRSSAQILRDLMKNPEFATNLATRMIWERQQREERMNAFRDSETFQKMVAALKKVNGKIDSESFAYFPEREMGGAGWSEFSREDVETMLDLCAQPGAPWVDPDSLKRDEDSPFLAYEYTISGLRIGFLSGQGTVVVVRPDTGK